MKKLQHDWLTDKQKRMLLWDKDKLVLKIIRLQIENNRLKNVKN